MNKRYKYFIYVSTYLIQIYAIHICHKIKCNRCRTTAKYRKVIEYVRYVGISNKAGVIKHFIQLFLLQI